MSEPKIAGPWIEHREDQWVRVDASGTIVASVFPRGHAGYGWEVGERSVKEDRYHTSNENRAFAKGRADDALRADGFNILEFPPLGPTVRLPRPFDARCAEFLAGLQALTERTGVVIGVESGAYLGDPPTVEMKDSGGAGKYEEDYGSIWWVKS